MAVYTAVFSFFCIQRATTAVYGDPDNGLFLQSFWTTANLGWAFYNTYENASHLGVHNSLVFVLVLPFYVLAPRMETLLIVQTAALALGALAVFRLGARFLDEECGADLALAYLLYHPMHGVNYDQFNELSFLPAPLLFAFDALYRRRMGRFWACMLIALSCKEDVPFIGFMTGLYVAWLGWRQGRRDGRPDPLVWHGLALAAISVAWLLLSLTVLFPALLGGVSWPYFQERYGHIGGTFREVATRLLSHPWIALPYVFSHQGMLAFLEITGPLTFLPLRAPSVLIIAAPTWTVLHLSSYAAMHNCGSRYMAPVVAIAFVATVVGLRGAGSVRSQTDAPPPLGPADASECRRRCRAVLWITLAAALLFNASPLRFPFHRIPFATAHQRARQALAAQIPQGASVSTQAEFYIAVADRAEAWLGYHPGVEYLLVDDTPDASGRAVWYAHARWDVTLPSLVESGAYVVVARADGAALLRKASP